MIYDADAVGTAFLVGLSVGFLVVLLHILLTKEKEDDE